MGELPRLYETFFTVYVINYYFAVQQKSDGKVLPRQLPQLPLYWLQASVSNACVHNLWSEALCKNFLVPWEYFIGFLKFT